METSHNGSLSMTRVVSVLLGGLALFLVFGIVGAFAAGAVHGHTTPWTLGPVLVFPGLIVGFVFLMVGFDSFVETEPLNYKHRLQLASAAPRLRRTARPVQVRLARRSSTR